MRAIATFEAAKGLLVILMGFGALSFHHDLVELGTDVISHLHLNPAHHLPSVLLNALEHAERSDLRWIALGALAYSALRFTEAYGLWFQKTWAEWLAIVTGGIYLPVEIVELCKRLTVVRVLITLLNLALVIYLLWVRKKAKRSSHSAVVVSDRV